jgi:tetratricopeptide (TPR) repeat protein
MDPKNADAWGLKSGIAMANHDHDEALKDVQQALALDPNRASFHAELGLIQASIPADANAAESQVREAVKLDPKNAAAHLLLAGMLQKKGDTAGAESEAQAATQADSKNIRAWAFLTALYYQNGDKAKAESTLMQATDALHDTPDGANLLYSFYRQTGQTGRAASVYAGLVNKYPNSAALKMTYAQVLADQGDLTRMQQVLDQLNKTNGEEPQVQALNGMLLLRTGKVNESVTLLQKAAKNAPDSVLVKFWLGEALKAKGDLPGAEHNFTAVTQANPNNLMAQKELALIAAQSQDNALLEQVSQALIARFPNDPSGYMWRAMTELKQNQPQQAEADLETALKKNPKDPQVLLAMAQIRFQQKRYPEGEQMLEQVLSADPGNLQATRMLISYDLFQKQPAKALTLLQQQISKFPNNSAFYDDLANVQLATKDTNGALNSSQKAMQVNPSDGAAMLAYTRATAASGNAAAAIPKWQAWATAHPNDPRGDVMIGTLEESVGNASAAMDAYKKALAIQPDQPVAQNNLAFLMLENGQDVDVALSLAQSARRTLPNSPNTADTLAWAYFHKGIYGSAKSLLEDAEKTYPNDASIQYHLGMVDSKMGDKAGATDHFKKAVSLAPGTPAANNATKALSTLS